MQKAIFAIFIVFLLVIYNQNNVSGSHPAVMWGMDMEKAANHCHCVEYNCGCCLHIVEKEIRLDSTICTNATYLKKDYGFSLTVTFNKFTVFNETMSCEYLLHSIFNYEVRNPPPICMGAPFVKELAEVCVRIYDIQASSAHLHACVEVEAQMKHIHIAKYELGCFNMKGDGLKTALEQLENQIL
ncbi:Protein ITPRID1 [Frankliniella fusca]|uniref:Protein ITPRID1 n=1 Tax=Frankliniella fusca TaxID=407009 RepID=A0AAE1LHP4_9NEOP|nr:Protein ITPRID1 [Frankliniella fusca]